MSYKFRTELDVTNEVKGNPLERCCGCEPQIITWHIFGTGFRRASHLGAQKILAILCRTNSTDITKDLRKVLLRLEATGNGHVQYPRIGSTQHRFSTLNPLAPNKLMRGLAG